MPLRRSQAMPHRRAILPHMPGAEWPPIYRPRKCRPLSFADDGSFIDVAARGGRFSPVATRIGALAAIGRSAPMAAL